MHRPLHERLGARWVAFVLRWRRGALALALVLATMGVWLAAQLELDAELRNLLPEGNKVVRAAEEIERRFGALASIEVLVTGGTPEARRAYADAVEEALTGHPMLDRVDARVGPDFFTEHALYYLSDADFEALEDRLAAWQHAEFCGRAPDVCTLPPDPDAADRLVAFIDEQRARARETGAGDFTRYYEREGGDALALFLHPTQATSDLEFVLAIRDEVETTLASVRARDGPWQGAGLSVNAVGSYMSKAYEYGVAQRDMVRCGLIGGLAVVAITLLAFRSARALLVLLAPLLAGVAWTLGITELAVGHLNTITSLITSAIMGMGIDAGVHILGRYRDERDAGFEPEEATTRALAALTGPLLVASSTTLGGFAVMAGSDFPAFYELGVVAAIGVVMCLAAMLTVLPAMLVVTDPRPRPRAEPEDPSATTATRLLRRPAPLLVLVALVTAAAAPFAERVREAGIVRNARTLSSAESRARFEPHERRIRELMGKEVSPSVLVVDDYPTLARVHDAAKELHAARVTAGESVVDELFAAPALLPPKSLDQQARRAAIEALTEDFDERLWARLGAGDDPAASAPSDGGPAPLAPEDATLLRRMVAATPFGPDDLPDSIRAQLQGDDGSWAMFAYPAFDPGDIVTGLEFLAETRDYTARPEEQVYVGEATVFAAMWDVMRDEAPRRLGLAFGLVALIVFAQLRSVGHTLLTLLPLCVGLLWMLGVMGALGLQFSLYNIAILPVVIGVGVDNGVYLTAALRGARDRDARARALRHSGGAIAIAALTTGGGFASFMTADYVGLRGIGHVAVLGILAAALAAILILPAAHQAWASYASSRRPSS